MSRRKQKGDVRCNGWRKCTFQNCYHYGWHSKQIEHISNLWCAWCTMWDVCGWIERVRCTRTGK